MFLNQEIPMTVNSSLTRIWLTSAALLLLPQTTTAHSPDLVSPGIVQGIVHPLGGADHIAAILAVGLWAACMGGRNLQHLAISFVASMAVGAVLAVRAVSLQWVEPGIMTSLLVLGFFLVVNFRPSRSSAGIIVAMFGIFHGYAHGTVIANAADSWAFMAGLTGASLALIFLGSVTARILRRMNWNWAIRGGGVGISALGVSLMVMSV